jgi:hypothetical protein
MTTSHQEHATVTKDEHAPVWVSVVSGLTGQAPLTREHAQQRLMLILRLTGGLILLIGVTVALTEVLR